MAVVINEFEVVPGEASPKREASSSFAQGGSASQPEPPEPEEIERLLERERERCERIWAH